MTELYSVFSEDDNNLPVATNLSEDEAYLLNLRISAIDDQSLLSSSMYRSNPADAQIIEELESSICELLGEDKVPLTYAKAKKVLKKIKLSREDMNTTLSSLQELYTELVNSKTELFVATAISKIGSEYEERFGILLSDGTLDTVLRSRISDFEDTIIGSQSLSGKDEVYLENLLFMLEAFYNITDSSDSDRLDPKAFGEAIAIFDKKSIVQLAETINYCLGGEEDDEVVREYASTVGAHETPPFLYTLYLIQSINRNGFIKWLKSSLFSDIKRASNAVDLFERAMDGLRRSDLDIDLGQGSNGGRAIFGGMAERFQNYTSSFDLAMLNASLSCIISGKGTLNSLKALAFSDSKDILLYRQALISASITPTDDQLTSPVICTFLLSFAMCSISREETTRQINVYLKEDDGVTDKLDSNGERILDRVVTSTVPSPSGKFKGFLSKAKDPQAVLNRVIKFNAGKTPLLPSEILDFYYKVDISPDALQVILPNDDDPTIRQFTYMRWMSYLYIISSVNTDKHWGTASWDTKPTRMLIENKSFNDDVTAMIFDIRKGRTKKTKNGKPNPFKKIINSDGPAMNPFLNEYELGFNYEAYEGDKATSGFDPEFVKALERLDHLDTFKKLFPTTDFCRPSAIALGFVGAILSPYKDWNDIRNYKCEFLPHGNVEYPNIEVYATAKFNPVTIVTGHADLTSCCMYPGAYGRSTVINDFLHPSPVSTLLAFDTAAKNNGNKAYFDQESDVVCLGSIFNARTLPTLSDPSKVSNDYKLAMVEGDTKLFLRYNEPVPYKIGPGGAFETPVATLDGFEKCDNNLLVSSSVLGYDFEDVAKNCMAAAINSSPKYNYMISGVHLSYGADFSMFGIEDASSAGISFEGVRGELEIADGNGNTTELAVADNVYTDGRQNYPKVRSGFFGSLDVADASSAFGTMVVSFDSEGDDAVVGYLDLEGSEVPQIEVSWDYLRYMFSFPMGNAFVPFGGCVCFDTSAKNKAVCMELLTPAWFASANEKPLVRGENEYNQADLIEMRTPKQGAFLGKTQIL